MALIQAIGSNNGAGATTLTVVLPTITAGSLLVVMIGTSSNVNISSVSDTVNGAWPSPQASPGAQKVGHAFLKNSAASASSVTITVTISASSDGVICALEESGMDTTSPADKGLVLAQNSQTGVTTATSTSTGVLSQANEVGFANSYSFNSQNLFSNAGLSSGWAALTGTGITTGLINAPSGECMFVQRKLYAATTADTSTVTCDITANPFTAISTWKVAAGGGGGGGGQQNRLLLGVG